MASLEEISTPASADGTSSQDRSLGSSAQGSRSNSRPPKKNARIHWHSQGEQIDTRQQKSKFNVRDHSASPPKRDGKKPLPRARRDSLQKPRAGNTSSAAQSPSFPQNVNEALRRTSPRPSILRQASNDSNDSRNSSDEENKRESPNSIGKAVAQRTAESKAQRLSRDLGIRSAPGSRLPSPVSSPPPSPPPEDQYTTPIDLDSIPLQRLESKRRSYGIEDDTESEESEEDDTNTHKRKKHNRFYKAARRLVNHHTTRKGPQLFRVPAMSSQTSLRSGQVTPEAAKDPNNYVPRPKQYREGILSSLMRLYNGQVPSAASAGHPLEHTRNNLLSRSRESLFGSIRSPLSSGRVTPDQRKQSDPVIPKHQKWYVKDPSPSSTPSIANLVNSSSMLAQPTAANITKAEESTPPAQGNKAGMRPVPMQKPSASGSNEVATRLFNKLTGAVPDDEFKIHLHIADVMKRHQYLLKLCKMLMSYGAPTHRLEEYMRMSARVLEVEGQFLYLPGCMLVSFDDSGMHTTEVRIVRTAQGVHLSKLRDTHEVYKEVVHDRINLDDAMMRLDAVARARNIYSPWLLVIVYGLASMCVGPFAFGARPIDLPIAFLLGCVLGILQIIISPRSELYSNVSEVAASVITSFLARAFGSIHNGELFCFSALAQSSIALILPGYIVLCGSLELQSKSIVAGSVRMVYAVIYSLFLGFGITIGTSFYGGIDKNATSDITCRTRVSTWWYPFIFVPPFTICLIVINHGRVKQMPVMLGIAFSGYIVNHFSAKRFASNAQIANTLGALTVGVLGNLYSRLRHGLAAAALLPAVFVQVPSGLAASGSLVSGVTSANQITNQLVNGTAPQGTTTVDNGTQAGLIGGSLNSMVLNVGYSMIQIAIGITVGLFLSALVVYPFGKRRSGLFSF